LNRLKLNDEEEITNILIETLDTCVAARKYTEVEKIYSFIESRNFTNEKILIKLADSLISARNWKNSFLLYTQTNNNNVKKEIVSGINLSANLKINELKKNIDTFEEKYNRLLKLQHLKRTSPHLFMFDNFNKQMEDNVSDSGSVVSSGSYKTGKSSKTRKSGSSRMTKKSQAKLAKRNVKEGSPLEEEFLIMVLSELKLAQTEIDNIKDLLWIMSFLNSSPGYAKELKTILESYLKNVNSVLNINNNLLTVAQQDYINKNPEIREIFPKLFGLDEENKQKKKFIK
jgi:hypothetical protein